MVRFEIKKVFSRPGGKMAALLLGILLAVTTGFAAFGVDFVNEEGVTETGIAAARKLRSAKKEWEGVLSEERIAQVIAENARINATEEYCSRDIQKQEIAYGWKQGFSDIRYLIVNAFSAFREFDYYIVDSLSPDAAGNFYQNRVLHLKEWLDTEEKDTYSQKEKEFLIGRYESLETPLYYEYADGWHRMMEFSPTIIMITMLILGFLTAGIFAGEFAQKSDAVFYSSCHGRGKAIAAKIKAGIWIVTGVYWAMLLSYTFLVLGILGADGAGSRIQSDRSGWKSFYDLTNLQEYVLVVLGGYLGCLFCLLLTMLVSAWAKSSVIAVIIPFVLLFLPSFLSVEGTSFLGDVLGLLPNRLLEMNMTLVYFNLYQIGGKVTGAAEILFPLYAVPAVLLCPLICRIYKNVEVR